MRILLFLIASIIWLNANGLNWIKSFDKGAKIAKKSGKVLMVFVEASHCPWCEKMKKDVLEKPDNVKVLNKNYVLVKLDIDSKDVKKYFPNTYITPTTYFLSSDIKPLIAIEGYVNEESFYWYLGDVDRKLKGK